jgi:hypothetical protein
MIIQTSDRFDSYFFLVIHHVIRAYVDVMEKYSFSLGMYMPESMPKNQENGKELKYTICRITFRSPVSNLRSDMNGLDLYTSSVLGADRYDISNKLFNILKLKLSNT